MSDEDHRLIDEARGILRLLVKRNFAPDEAVDILLIGLLGLYDGTFMPGNYDVDDWRANVRQAVSNLLGELENKGN